MPMIHEAGSTWQRQLEVGALFAAIVQLVLNMPMFYRSDSGVRNASLALALPPAAIQIDPWGGGRGGCRWQVKLQQAR